MDSKSSTASVNISLNSGSEHKLTQLIVEDEENNPLFFCIFKIDQIINDHEWTTNSALLFSDEIASKLCNHNRLLYVVILC